MDGGRSPGGRSRVSREGVAMVLHCPMGCEHRRPWQGEERLYVPYVRKLANGKTQRRALVFKISTDLVDTVLGGDRVVNFFLDADVAQ